MPFDASGRWIPEDDSVSVKLTGLLADNSKYMQTARAAGERTAHKRGLLNSSIAAGAAENAAIAAAAPIASQDASQTAQKNQAVIEGGISLDNQTKLNAQQIEGQSQLQAMQDKAALERAKLSESGASARQLAEFDARKEEQVRQIASSERQAAMQNETSLTQAQMSANANLSSMYLQAFSNLAANPEIPAATRNAYQAELQRVLREGQGLIGVVKSVPLDWGGSNPPPVPGPPIASQRPGVNMTDARR